MNGKMLRFGSGLVERVVRRFWSRRSDGLDDNLLPKIEGTLTDFCNSRGQVLI